MSFPRPGGRRSSSDTVVHAVGQRVYVNRSASSRTNVDLMNDEGTAAIASLADGVEVMVVAWKPRGATGTRYCVRCTRDGLEGWLAAANLRRAPTAAPPPAAPVEAAQPAPAPPKSRTGDSKPRFGGR